MIKMLLGDVTDQREVLMFSDPGESLLQQTAKKLHFYKSIAPDMLQDIFNLTKFKKLQFLLETTTTLVEDAPTITTKVKEWMTVHVIENNRRLLEEIKLWSPNLP